MNKYKELNNLNFIRVEHLFVFGFAKYVSIQSMIFYLASFMPRLEFYKEVSKVANKRIADDCEIIVEEIELDTVIVDNPDNIMYCSKTGPAVDYNSVQDLIKDVFVMKLSGVYV